MKVVLTAEALGDLEQIGDYIAQDNPARAASFIDELIGKARQLGDLPGRIAFAENRYPLFRAML